MRAQHWIYTVPLKLRSLFRRRKVEQELDEELQDHLASLREEYVAAGMSAEEAHYAALRQMGGVDQVKEECRDRRGGHLIETLLQDVRYAIRLLRKSPGFASITVLTLALGIGANTAVFSFLDAFMGHSLPYRQPERLVMVAYGGHEISPANFADLASRNRSFESIAAVGFWNVNLGNVPAPERLMGFKVSPNFFDTLGVLPAMGRSFREDEAREGKQFEVVVSNAFWKGQLGGDPGALGKELRLNGDAYTVIGVMSPDFTFYRGADLWAPLAMSPQTAATRDSNYLIAAGRLSHGMSLAAAQQDIARVAAAITREYPEHHGNLDIRLVSMAEAAGDFIRPVILMLLGAIGMVLLIACANIGNLLLTRASARRKEMALRAALGASRSRIVRQSLVESAVIAFLGTAVGMLLGQWLLRTLIRMIPPGAFFRFPEFQRVTINEWVLGFTAMVGVGAGIIFGLAPALQSSSPQLGPALKEGVGACPANGRRLRTALVIGEVALSVVLLAGAGLFLRSFLRLLQVDPGFDPSNVLTMQLNLSARRYPTPEQRAEFFRQLSDKLAALPGVDSAGAISDLPLGGSNSTSGIQLEGQAVENRGEGLPIRFRVITPGYLETLRIPVVAGRDFARYDTSGQMRVALINLTAARRYWPGQAPVGKHFRFTDPDMTRDWWTVVGVVADNKQDSLGLATDPGLFLPYAQAPLASMAIVVRTRNTPESLISTARNRVTSLDPEQPVFQIATLQEVVARSTMMQRVAAIGVLALAAFALLLAAGGVYGVISYGVSQRTREIGIRMAIGGQARDVVRLVLRQGLRLLLIGAAVGLAGALAVARAFAPMLFEVKPYDPITFVMLAAILGLVGLVASYLPARRATKVDPMVALRYE